MANSFASNFTRKLARVFLDKFESARVLSKSVNTQLLTGKFSPSSGTIVDFKRPTDYKSTRTSNGDISGGTPSAIITGKASGTVQDYFTVDVEYAAVDEALKMDQLEQLLAPMATRIATDLEIDFALFMLKNAGLSIGSPDTPVTTWQHVADAGALMKSLGIPSEEAWCYAMNPFTMAKLAGAVESLSSSGAIDADIKTAYQKAVLKEAFAGMRVMSCDSLRSVTTAAITDRAGSLAATPDGTYLTAKDSMTQSLSVTGFTASLTVKAGEIVEITGRNMINLSTKQPFLTSAGTQLKFRAVVTADVLLGSSGEGTLVVAGPGIYEANGAYNTVDSALTSADVVTLLGTASTTYQPNLFFHKNAFAIGSVPQTKLYSTDTLATTEDGLQIRVSKYADGSANLQKVRFDLLPAYAVLNPFFAGQGHA